MNKLEFNNTQKQLDPQNIEVLKHLIISIAPKYKDAITRIFLVFPVVKNYLSELKILIFRGKGGQYDKVKLYQVRRLYRIYKKTKGFIESLIVIFGKEYKVEIINIQH